MTYLQAVVIGLIQGLTELFPISSLGHTVLIPSWLGGTWATLVRQESSSESPYLAFIVGLHLATAVVLIGYYFKTWVRIIRGFFTSIATRRVESADQKLAWLLIIATDSGGDRRAGPGAPVPGPVRQAAGRGDLPHHQRRHPGRRRGPAPPASRPRCPRGVPQREPVTQPGGWPSGTQAAQPAGVGRPAAGAGRARRAARGTVPLPR